MGLAGESYCCRPNKAAGIASSFREGGPSANPISKECRVGTRKGLVNEEGSFVLHSRNVISCRVEGT